MNANDALLLSFDKALGDQWESLAQSMHDLDDDLLNWQHEAYADEPHDQGVGKPGTILWHLNHLELCHRHYLATIKAMDLDDPPETKPAGEMNFAEVKSALERVNAELRAAIKALAPEDLAKIIRPKRDIADFIAMFTRHIVWHAAQIAVIRRLYAKR